MLYMRDKLLILIILMCSLVSADLQGGYLYGFVKSNSVGVDNALVYVYSEVDGCLCASQLASQSGQDGSYAESLDNLVFIQCDKYSIGQDCSKYIDIESNVWLEIESPDNYFNLKTSKVKFSDLVKDDIGFNMNDVFLKNKESNNVGGSQSGGSTSTKVNSGDTISTIEEPVIAQDIKDAVVDSGYKKLIEEKKGKVDLLYEIEYMKIRKEEPSSIVFAPNSVFVGIIVLVLLLVIYLALFRSK